MSGGYERITAGIREAVDPEVDVQLGPMEMVAMQQLDIQNVLHFGLTEPGELFVGHEVLGVSDTKPYAMTADVGDLNRRSAGSRRFGFHHCVP
jgi:hypothetical protein